MNEIRGFFTRMKKGGEKDKGKVDRLRAEVSGSEGATSTSLLWRPESHVRVGGSHDREDHGADTERKEIIQGNPDPDVEVAARSGPSQEGSDIDGRKTDGHVDPPHPSPSTPSTLYGGEPEGTWRELFTLLPLIVSPDDADDPAVPDHFQEALALNQNDPDTTGERESDWKSAASAAAKLLLHGVRESVDAFGPLKSVAGGLCFILENREVWPSAPLRDPQRLPVPQRMKANEEAIESLAPRIKALSALLCKPVSRGDVKERSRRGELER